MNTLRMEEAEQQSVKLDGCGISILIPQDPEAVWHLESGVSSRKLQILDR